MSTYAKVRRLFHRDHLSISEIQRRTSLSRNTIKAWLKETCSDGYKYSKRPKVNSKLTPFVPALLLALEADFCNVASGWEKGIVEKNVLRFQT